MKRLMTGAAALILMTSVAYAQAPGSSGTVETGRSGHMAPGAHPGLTPEPNSQINNGPARDPLAEGGARDLTPKGETPGVTEGAGGGR